MSVKTWLVDEAVSVSQDPAKNGQLLKELALAGGRDTLTALASKTQLTQDEVKLLLDAPRARALVVLDGAVCTHQFAACDWSSRRLGTWLARGRAGSSGNDEGT